MATQITSTNLHNPDYIFSSRVADIKASTWKDKVNVSLTCRNGAGAGPSKMKKIEDLRASGHNIRVIFEPELISLLQ